MRTALILLFLLALGRGARARCFPQRGADPATVDAVPRRSTRRSAPCPRPARRCSTSSARRGSPRSTCCCSSRWSAACSRGARCTLQAMRATAAGRAAQPRPAARAPRRTTDAGRPDGRARRPRGGAARRGGSGSTSHRRPRTVSRREGLPARDRQPASSTSRCSCCCSASRSARLFGYHGNVIVVEGAASPTPSRVRPLRAGRLADVDDLPPFSFTLDELHRDATSGAGRRTAPRALRRRRARSRDTPARGGAPGDRAGQRPAADRRHQGLPGRPRLRPARHRARRQGQRRAQRAGAVPAAGRQVPVARASSRSRTRVPTQLGFRGVFLPTAAIDPVLGRHLAVPGRRRPAAAAHACSRATSASTTASPVGLPARHDQDDPGRRPRRCASATPGRCPTASGSVTFDGVREFASFSVAHDPGKGPSSSPR